jgi:hypothetical protein
MTIVLRQKLTKSRQDIELALNPKHKKNLQGKRHKNR